MTIEEARKLIPPGWVECDEHKWAYASPGIRVDYGWDEDGVALTIYAIPAPKPEPRRVPMGEMVVWFDNKGFGGIAVADVLGLIRDAFGGYGPVANTKWRLDLDAREWVEVME